jgi:hypothetical protein
MTDLRPYQENVIAEFHRVVALGQRRVILVAPTGAGKTIIAAKIIKLKVAARQNVLVLAHRCPWSFEYCGGRAARRRSGSSCLAPTKHCRRNA